VDPIKRNSPVSEPLSDALSRRLEQLILDGTLKPGRKIPSERQLAERLGVSRNILREALRGLRGRGLIETRHGQGSVVARLVPGHHGTNPLTHLFRDHSRMLFDLLDVREVLEAKAAYLAAERASEDDLRRITFMFNALDQAPPPAVDALEVARLDHAFHQAICEASRNPVLMHTLESLMQLMLSSVLACVNNLYHRPASKREIERHHRQIYNAVLNHQPEQAERAAAAHIRGVRERLLEIEREEQRLERSANWEKLFGSG